MLDILSRVLLLLQRKISDSIETTKREIYRIESTATKVVVLAIVTKLLPLDIVTKLLPLDVVPKVLRIARYRIESTLTEDLWEIGPTVHPKSYIFTYFHLFSHTLFGPIYYASP